MLPVRGEKESNHTGPAGLLEESSVEPSPFVRVVLPVLRGSHRPTPLVDTLACGLYTLVCVTRGLGSLQPAGASEALVSSVGHLRIMGERQENALNWPEPEHATSRFSASQMACFS